MATLTLKEQNLNLQDNQKDRKSEEKKDFHKKTSFLLPLYNLRVPVETY